jgi:transposase
MNSRFRLRELSEDELVRLQDLLRAGSTPAELFTRCRLIWLLAGGYSIARASEYVGLHYTNAHEWVKRFEAEGVDGLHTRPRSGRPRVYDQSDEDVIIDLATSRPQDLGLDFTTWSLAKLTDYLHHHEHLPDMSHETVRRMLHRRGLRHLTGVTWCESDDPEFEAKRGR